MIKIHSITYGLKGIDLFAYVHYNVTTGKKYDCKCCSNNKALDRFKKLSYSTYINQLRGNWHMAKITIELDDNLEDDVKQVIEEVEEEFRSYLKDNKPSSCPDMGDLDYSGAIHEIVDGTVPIYTRELEDAYYLHSNELDQALDNAGLYNDADLGRLTSEQRVQSGYYCYLQEAVAEWFADEAESIYDEWVESGQNDYSVGDIVFWNDPEGVSSRNAIISEFVDGKVILDNGEIEAFASELEPEHEEDE